MSMFKVLCSCESDDGGNKRIKMIEVSVWRINYAFNNVVRFQES